MLNKEYAITTKNLIKHYTSKDGKITPVNNVSLKLEKGKITCLLGENGAGKSTLIKCLLGLTIPDDGSINYNVKEKHPIHSIGCILEGERNIYYYLTVYDNLYYFGKLNNIKRFELIRRIDDILSKLEILHKKNTYVAELSRGMQQKVALAILLIRDPEILLLDEPTLGLDVQSSNFLINYLSKLSRTGKTILLTTHQMDVAESLSDNIILYKDGEIIKEDSKNNILKNYDFKSKFIITLDKNFNQNKYKFLKEIDLYKYEVSIEQINEFFMEVKNQNINIINIHKEEKRLKDIFIEYMER